MTIIEYNKVKVGNLLVFLSEKIRLIDRAKLMKLVYFVDEAAIKERGVPVTWFDYQVCKKGPVPMEMWSDKLSGANRFAEYVDIYKNESNVSVVTPKVNFDHTEFSKNEIRIINNVISNYGGKSFDELSNITHEVGTPWALAKEKYGVKDNEDSESMVDLSLAASEELRSIYEEACDFMRFRVAMAS